MKTLFIKKLWLAVSPIYYLYSTLNVYKCFISFCLWLRLRKKLQIYKRKREARGEKSIKITMMHATLLLFIPNICSFRQQTGIGENTVILVLDSLESFLIHRARWVSKLFPKVYK